MLRAGKLILLYLGVYAVGHRPVGPRLRRLLRQHGLPQPISNGIVCGYEVDLHWPELKLVAELDGYAYHGHERAFETDRERDIVLAVAGWQTVRVTDRQLTDQPAQTAERFAAQLSSRVC